MRSLSEYLLDELEIDAVRKTNYGTLVFKAGTKVVTAYSNGKLEIKEYQANTLANNGPLLLELNDATSTPDDGFLTDDGIARKYIKSIVFDTTNVAPSNYNISWDVSELKDGTVMCYATGNETNGYDLTIVADGEIYMPKNSSGLFQYCGYNESLPEYTINLSGLNASKVENMFNAFCDFGYYSMTNFDLGESFYTSNAVITEGMFARCGYTSMITLDLGNYFDTSNVTDMQSMFASCGYNLMSNLDLGDSFDTSNVTNMTSMFQACGYFSLTDLDLGNNFDTSNVTTMYHMFCDCGYTAMVDLNLGDKFDTSNVTNMAAIFARCGYMNLETLNLGDKFNTSNARNMKNSFLELRS